MGEIDITDNFKYVVVTITDEKPQDTHVILLPVLKKHRESDIKESVERVLEDIENLPSGLEVRVKEYKDWITRETLKSICRQSLSEKREDDC